MGRVLTHHRGVVGHVADMNEGIDRPITRKGPDRRHRLRRPHRVVTSVAEPSHSQWFSLLDISSETCERAEDAGGAAGATAATAVVVACASVEAGEGDTVQVLRPVEGGAVQLCLAHCSVGQLLLVCAK